MMPTPTEVRTTLPSSNCNPKQVPGAAAVVGVAVAAAVSSHRSHGWTLKLFVSTKKVEKREAKRGKRKKGA